jgi:hypothetical protein
VPQEVGDDCLPLVDDRPGHSYGACTRSGRLVVTRGGRGRHAR